MKEKGKKIEPQSASLRKLTGSSPSPGCDCWRQLGETQLQHSQDSHGICLSLRNFSACSLETGLSRVLTNMYNFYHTISADVNMIGGGFSQVSPLYSWIW